MSVSVREHPPLVYISILNWNGSESAIRLVRAIQEQTYKNIKIIIVDNASQDDSVAQIRKVFPDIELIQAQENQGYACGHRYTVEVAIKNNAELIWILNTDIVLTNDRVLLALVEAYSSVRNGIFGSVILNSDDTSLTSPIDYTLEENTKTITVVRGNRPYIEQFPDNTLKRVLWVGGASFFIPVEVIRKHGFMDERFFLYGEEYDYCYRLGVKGVLSYIVPDSQIVHPNGISRGNNSNIQKICSYYLLRNQMIIVRWHYGWLKYISSICTLSNIKLIVKVFLMSLKHFGNNKAFWGDYLRLLALRDSLLERMGKTFSPEDYL